MNTYEQIVKKVDAIKSAISKQNQDIDFVQTHLRSWLQTHLGGAAQYYEMDVVSQKSHTYKLALYIQPEVPADVKAPEAVIFSVNVYGKTLTFNFEPHIAFFVDLDGADLQEEIKALMAKISTALIEPWLTTLERYSSGC